MRKNKQVVFRPSIKILYGAGIFAIFMTPIALFTGSLGFLLFPAAILLYILYIFFSQKLVLENDSLSFEESLISKKRISIPLHKITDLHYRQNAIERMLNLGSLEINTAGSEREEISFLFLDSPENVQKEIKSRLP